MSIETKMVCDSCGEKADSKSKGWIGLDVRGFTFEHRAVMVQDIHVCSTCYPKIVALLPNAGKALREALDDMTVSRKAEIKFASRDKDGQEIRVMPGRVIQMINTPGEVFLGSGLRIDVPAAHDWVIEEIRIGNRSQFAQAGHVPADQFAAPGFEILTFEPAGPSTKIEICAAYIGKNPEGARFACTMFGGARGNVTERKVDDDGRIGSCVATIMDRGLFMREDLTRLSQLVPTPKP